MSRTALFTVVLIVLSLPPSMCRSATIDRAVIGQAGGQVRAGTIIMDLSIGEPIIGTAASGSVQVDFGYWWTILTVNVGVENDAPLLAYAMRQNAPNPFTTATRIAYTIPAGSRVPVFIGIYDLGGRLVRTLVHETKMPGQYSASWDGTTDSGTLVLAGVYFAKFHAGPFRRTSKLVMLK